MDFDLLQESIETIKEWLDQYNKDIMHIKPEFNLDQLPKVVDYFRKGSFLM